MLDQTRAADLEGVHRWRIVYHYRSGNIEDGSWAETIAWFHVTAEAAWADAAALLPPAGYEQPHAVTVERGTYTALPEGGYGWEQLRVTQHAQVEQTGLVLDHDGGDLVMTPTAQAAALTSAGQQHLF